MTARVPRAPQLLVTTNIKSGKAARGADWENMARTANWLSGGGATLVAAHSPMTEVGNSESKVFHFTVEPRGRADHWLIILVLSSRERGIVAANQRAALSALGTWGVVGGDVHEWQVNGQMHAHFECIHYVTPSSDETSFSIAVSESELSPDAVSVEQISVYEVPRYSLDPDALADSATDVDSCKADAPIYDAGDAGMSVDAWHESICNNATGCRRAGLAAWSDDDGYTYPIASVGSWHLAMSWEVLGRQLYVGDTTDSLNWWVYAQNGGLEAVVKLVSSAGYSSVLTITSNTAQWWGPGTITHPCEDLGESDGYTSPQTLSLYMAALESLPVVYGLCVGES